ncbi:MAG: GNAT family N-acetyltransferase [candidate division Zixibacteria bacterium]|nr:GNAT family N-acetyltransferase [candidate division Zixibacteria bacterium]
MVIRPLREEDSLEELTRLLNRAYKSLADAGLRYVATYQDAGVTRNRIGQGTCLVAVDNDRIIGTILYHPPAQTHGSAWLDRDDVGHISQLGVEPAMQSRGIAGALIAAAEAIARSSGAAEIALDTAEPAKHLIGWYERLGYRFIEYVSWDVTNYRSVVMSKMLAP